METVRGRECPPQLLMTGGLVEPQGGDLLYELARMREGCGVLRADDWGSMAGFRLSDSEADESFILGKRKPKPPHRPNPHNRPPHPRHLWLNGKHVVFGQVVEGMNVVKANEAVGSQFGATKKPVVIADCGQLFLN